jgi:hypothetical protein
LEVKQYERDDVSVLWRETKFFAASEIMISDKANSDWGDRKKRKAQSKQVTVRANKR